MSLADIDRVASMRPIPIIRGTLSLPRTWQGRGEIKEDQGVQEREAKQPEDEAMADYGADQNLATRTEPVLKHFIFAII